MFRTIFLYLVLSLLSLSVLPISKRLCAQNTKYYKTMKQADATDDDNMNEACCDDKNLKFMSFWRVSPIFAQNLGHVHYSDADDYILLHHRTYIFCFVVSLFYFTISNTSSLSYLVSFNFSNVLYFLLFRLFHASLSIHPMERLLFLTPTTFFFSLFTAFNSIESCQRDILVNYDFGLN